MQATKNLHDFPQDIALKVMTSLHGRDKACAARAAPVFANTYQDSFTAEDYWHACGQSDKPARLRVTHCARKRNETRANYWQRACEEITLHRRVLATQVPAYIPSSSYAGRSGEVLRNMAVSAQHHSTDETTSWMHYAAALRAGHRHQEAQQFDWLTEAQAELVLALDNGDATAARALLMQGAPPPRLRCFLEVVNANPDLVTPFLNNLSPLQIYSYPAILKLFVAGTAEVRSRFYLHPHFKRSPHMAGALFQELLRVDSDADSALCAVARELLTHCKISRPENPPSDAREASHAGGHCYVNTTALVQGLISRSLRYSVKERVELLLSCSEHSTADLNALLGHGVQGSQECLQLLVCSGADPTAVLWELIRRRAPRRGGVEGLEDWVIVRLARLGARVGRSELDAYFRSINQYWAQHHGAKLRKKLKGGGALTSDMPLLAVARQHFREFIG